MRKQGLALMLALVLLVVQLTTAQAGAISVALVKDINPGIYDNFALFPANMNGTLYFLGYDGVHGYEPWKSDGTASGTVMLKDICPGPSCESMAQDFTYLNGTVFFGAADGTDNWQLWKTDGTAAGTVLLSNVDPNYLTPMGNTLFFAGCDKTYGCQLWKSDGTPGGTVMVKDINPGNNTPHPMINMNGTLILAVGDGEAGGQLWRSDGTEGGTVLIKTLNGLYLAGGPYRFTLVNGLVYFVANGNDGHNYELWRTDGTEAGTYMVADINPGPGHCGCRDLTNVNGTLYFVATDGVHGPELWKLSGGTPVMVKDIEPGNTGAGPDNLVNVNGVVYFIDRDLAGDRRLWKSDGTAGGTMMVTAEKPDAPTLGHEMVNVKGRLFFPGFEEAHGVELWTSDGTDVGTVLVKDINTGSGGSASSSPGKLTDVNGILFFFANDGTHGCELWSTSPAAAAPTITLAFSSNSAPPGQAVPMTATITNQYVGSLSGLAYSHSLPTHLVIATPPSVSNTCGGTVTAVAGGSTITLAGGSLAEGGACAVRVNVKATVEGTYTTSTGPVSATETGAGSGSNQDTLLIAALEKLFLPLLKR